MPQKTFTKGECWVSWVREETRKAREGRKYFELVMIRSFAPQEWRPDPRTVMELGYEILDAPPTYAKERPAEAPTKGADAPQIIWPFGHKKPGKTHA